MRIEKENYKWELQMLFFNWLNWELQMITYYN
jgi:hypothetical protein